MRATELNTPLEYIETTIPPGMTLRDYARRLPRRPSRWVRLKQLAAGAKLSGVAAPAA